MTEPVYDSIPADQFLKTDAQIAAALGPAYGGLRGITWDWFNPSEASSDELIVPTRGGDWFDGGDWLAYSRHTWTPQHGPINGMWGFIFGNISQVNQLIPVVAANQKAVDELRAVRAIYYFMAVDAFGKVYLNAGVYKGATEWQKAYDTADQVIKSTNGWSLASSTLANFVVQNQGSGENIFAIPYDSFKAGGMNFHMRTLHYANQQTYGLGNSPWNGFCTLADFYNSFESNDLRGAMWIKGQQYAASGAKLKDAKGMITNHRHSGFWNLVIWVIF